MILCARLHASVEILFAMSKESGLGCLASNAPGNVVRSVHPEPETNMRLVVMLLLPEFHVRVKAYIGQKPDKITLMSTISYLGVQQNGIYDVMIVKEVDTFLLSAYDIRRKACYILLWWWQILLLPIYLYKVHGLQYCT